jgi:hypothetical protein
LDISRDAIDVEIGIDLAEAGRLNVAPPETWFRSSDLVYATAAAAWRK